MRRASVVLLLGSFALAICIGQVVPAQETEKKEEVRGSADVLRTSWGKKTVTLMKGNVRFIHGDTTITSEAVEYDEDAKRAVSPGKIHVTDPECDITGDLGSVDFNNRLGLIEGNVVMLVKPKKAEESASENESVKTKLSEPTTITCPKVEYQYRKKIVTATGGVSFKQPKRSASADKAVYDRNKELLTLVGNVKGVDEKGQTFFAPGKVLISLKNGDEWMEAENVTATFKIDLGEEEKAKQ